MNHRSFSSYPLRMVVLASLLGGMLASVSCFGKKPARQRSRSSNRATAERDTADLLENDFARLNNLPNGFSLRLNPPAVLLDARSTNDGKDVRVTISQAPGIENGPWNVLEVVSGNVNLRSIGVRPGDTIKCYLFPDSETRHRQNVTNDVDMQMVTHEATDLVVAQVLDDHRVQVVGGIVPPRDLILRISEEDYASTFNYTQADMDELRDRGFVDSFGVKLPAERLPLAQLAAVMPTISWPPRIEVWRVRDERMKAISRALGGYARRGEPPLGWEPSPDDGDLARLTESFNRWLRSRKKVEPQPLASLVDSLPESLRNDPRLKDHLSPEALTRNSFANHEGQLIQEAVWCRDIAGWAAGAEFDPLPRARRLFDWTVRNVTLTDSPRVLNHRPWHTLAAGVGTSAQRAWVFCQLCRQQRIDACVLTLPPAEGEQNEWLWCGAIDHGQLYLFDPQLGLEIASNEGGVATLEEVIADDDLLRSLDLEDSPYPATSGQAKQAVACVVADTTSLSSRAADLEKQQSGKSAIVLHTDADALAEELQEIPGVASAALWEHPFNNLRRRLRLASATTALAESARSAAASDFQPFAWAPRLWKARMLHLRGMVETEREARKKGVLHDPINDHRAAAQLYLHRSVRPSEKLLGRGDQTDPELLSIRRRNKTDATYWLGLLKFEQGQPAQSIAWLENKVLSREEAQRRATGIRYNLARAYEALSENEKAAELLEGDDSPQKHGNRLRARRLAKLHDAPQAESDAAPQTE